MEQVGESSEGNGTNTPKAVYSESTTAAPKLLSEDIQK